MSLTTPIHLPPLCGLSAVVTGASSGIGQQIAIQFAVSGANRLLVHYHRNRTGAESTAHQSKEHGADTIVQPCDFSDQEHTKDFVDNAFATLGHVDIWVHCAGADVLTGEPGQWSFQRKLEHLVEVDLIGTIMAGRLVGQRMHTQSCENDPPSGDQTKRPLPSIIFIGWDQASEGMEGDAGQMFGPIKAGVEAFAKSLAQHLAPSVRVNTISPGWIKTEWGKSTSDYWNARAHNQSLMNRWGTPADIAAAAVFLSSPSSNFITGQTIQVNGGWNRRYNAE